MFIGTSQTVAKSQDVDIPEQISVAHCKSNDLVDATRQMDNPQTPPQAETQPANTWIFQGNPDRYNIDEYLSRDPYIYWRAPILQAQIRLGDPCFIWRAGDAAGAIAFGHIAEEPRPKDRVNYPDFLGDDLWKEVVSSDVVMVGIQVEEVRLFEDDGYLSREIFLNHPKLKDTTIIKNPQGTVFRLPGEAAVVVLALWASSAGLNSAVLPGAFEGVRRLRQHYARERNQYLVRKKKAHFSAQNNGRVFCEVCNFDFGSYYPAAFGDGFIEAHHLSPLFASDVPQHTTLDDLLLVCSNCHRMIHRSKSVEGNLKLLRKHFPKGGAT